MVEYKQVILVRTDVRMGKGKLAVEVAHASLEAYKKALKTRPDTVRKWEEGGSRKIVVKTTLNELFQFKEWADRKGLPNALIRDAGKTQVEPGTVTALAVGPASDEELRETEKLKLL